jgi:hypothetical protein
VSKSGICASLGLEKVNDKSNSNNTTKKLDKEREEFKQQSRNDKCRNILTIISCYYNKLQHGCMLLPYSIAEVSY